MMTYRFNADGKKVSLLGFGAMRLATVDGKHANTWADGVSSASIDQNLLNEQVKLMLDGGVNYFDTSPAYCRGESERCLGEALKRSGYRREDYLIATKLSNFSPAQYPLAKCKEMFDASLRYLRTDYVDNYLLHNIGQNGFATFSKRYIENGAADWCAELRAAGRIRNLGFSFHGDPKAWDWCIENHGKYKWDFAQIQLNYVDWRHASATNSRNLNADELYNTLTKLKIPVVVMEPLLGGRLARYNYSVARELAPFGSDDTPARWALRFCGSLGNVLTVLSGMTFTEHIRENIETFSPLRPCGREEFAALSRAAAAMLEQNTIPCNSCNYCMACPYGLDIPAILNFRNQVLTAAEPPSPREVLRLYAKVVPEELRRADHCTGCGRCVPHCPQAINIPREMAEIDKWVDSVKSQAIHR